MLMIALPGVKLMDKLFGILILLKYRRFIIFKATHPDSLLEKLPTRRMLPINGSMQMFIDLEYISSVQLVEVIRQIGVISAVTIPALRPDLSARCILTPNVIFALALACKTSRAVCRWQAGRIRIPGMTQFCVRLGRMQQAVPAAAVTLPSIETRRLTIILTLSLKQTEITVLTLDILHQSGGDTELKTLMVMENSFI